MATITRLSQHRERTLRAAALPRYELRARRLQGADTELESGSFLLLLHRTCGSRATSQGCEGGISR